MKSKILLPISIIILLFTVVLIGCSSKASDTSNSSATNKQDSETSQNGTNILKLKAVSFLPSNHAYTRDVIPMWIEMIESEMDNIKIDWVGGPESIPTDDQFTSVQSGVVDIGFNVSPYFANEVPEADSMAISPFTPTEERDNGYFEYLSEQFEKAEVVYLGRWLNSFPFYFWSNFEIKTLDDFKGLRIRSNPLYHKIFEEIGAVPINVPPAEVYTALERNMIDGFGWALLGPSEDGWTEVTRYLVNEPFLNQQAAFFINSDRWNSFTPEQQATFLEISRKFEEKMMVYFDDEHKKEFSRLDELDIQVLKLPETDSKKFQEIIQSVKWGELEENNPGEIENLKSLLSE